MRAVVNVFELPKRLGILQYVDYSRPPKWCDSCLYEGVVTSEGCKKGICVKYRANVFSRDGRRWFTKIWRRGSEWGGCLKQQLADALWELAERGFDVRLRYERMGRFDRICGVILNGVDVGLPNCFSAEDCIGELIHYYKLTLEREEAQNEEQEEKRDPVDELLAEWPELNVFERERIREWLYAKDRLVELAQMIRAHPWMVEVLRKRRVASPYHIEVLEAVDSSEACLGIHSAFWCARGGEVREVELEHARRERRGDKFVKVYKPKGLLAFAEGAKEYVKAV